MKLKRILIFVIFVIPYLMLGYGYYIHKNEIENIDNSKIIIINKDDFSLKLYSYKGELLKNYDITIGKNFGNKMEEGDKKTPEGVFNILSIENSSNWEFDFEDDNTGPIKGAYGPWFLRLNIPEHKGIGIHGTHNNNNNNTIGKKDSKGCIRMRNNDLLELKEEVTLNTTVVILPSSYDLLINNDTTNVIEKMYLKTINKP